MPLDAHMVLRVLLEYYRNEKKMKLYVIRKLFMEESHDKVSLDFAQFRKVMYQIDSEMPDLLLARLFRDAWNIGNGYLTFDSFFLVANETGFFLRCMLLRSKNKPPVLDLKEDFDTLMHAKEPAEKDMQL